jgi:hypothetical protein
LAVFDFGQSFVKGFGAFVSRWKQIVKKDPLQFNCRPVEYKICIVAVGLESKKHFGCEGLVQGYKG